MLTVNPLSDPEVVTRPPWPPLLCPLGQWEESLVALLQPLVELANSALYLGIPSLPVLILQCICSWVA